MSLKSLEVGVEASTIGASGSTDNDLGASRALGLPSAFASLDPKPTVEQLQHMRVGLILGMKGGTRTAIVGCVKFDFELKFPGSTGGWKKGKGKTGKRENDTTWRWSHFRGNTSEGRRLKFSLVAQIADESSVVTQSFESEEIQRQFDAVNDTLVWEDGGLIEEALRASLFASNGLGKNSTQFELHLVYPQRYLSKDFPPELKSEANSNHPSEAYRLVRLKMLEKLFERVVPDHPDTYARFVKLLKEALRDTSWRTGVKGMVEVFDTLCVGSGAKGDKSFLTTHFTDGVGIQHVVKRAEGIGIGSLDLSDDVFDADGEGEIDIGDLSGLIVGGGSGGVLAGSVVKVG